MKLVIAMGDSFELWTAPPWFSERFRRDFPQLEVVHLSGYSGIEEHLCDAEITICWSLRPEQFQAARKLRWIYSPAAAVHQLLFPELVNSDVILTNGRDVHGPVVAEHVIALILALAKKLPQAARLQQKHTWGKELLWKLNPKPTEIAGATLGVVGLGSIGRNVSKHASALGMRVIAVREHPDNERPQGVDEVFGSSELDQLLGQSDYVVLSVPVTPETEGLINAKRLAKMKSTAYLINVGRGQLIDEAALLVALRGQKIGGAALDVFIEEPLPPDSPLWDLENLLITPHTAGLTEKMWERHYKLFTENLRRYMAGEELLAVVDKKKGY
jgi:phosphoglycerate dehydrogenase-like enzyme